MIVNLLPPMNTKNKIWVKEKIPISSIKDLHTWIISKFSNEDKKNTEMFSLIRMNGTRYLKENVTHVFGIVIDIDDGDYDEVKGKLDKRNVNYFMYTTHSNGKNGEERFRVVIVLDKQYVKKAFVSATPVLKEVFESFNIDNSTFNVARRFVLPPKGCKYDMNPNGKLFNLSPLVKEGEARERSKRRFENMSIEQTFKKNINGVKKYISKINWTNGDKHNTLVRLIYKFKSDGYTFEEIKSAVESVVSFKINWYLLRNIK